ncbi:ABC transporter permease [Kibdelosporangium persicum]|uniref:Binding-protein-dependent transport systems inner membrane component n=1 Tax=Kibdelosporangium persicum TaxID=2698649 RepID=A0ABX2F9F9_9PSEU|nr:ABC transporter permease [Kibdelosporangium persicum]NRN68006.1 Binding-protein-dependent transport systems inner membrane component [Kibdelosporangium persicum]
MSVKTLDTAYQVTPSRWSRRNLTVPIGLIAAVAVLWLWVSSLNLDSIEARVLNAEAVRRAVVDHILLAVSATLLVVAIAVPLGIMLTRRWAKPLVPVVMALANIGQAVPALGLLVLLALWFGIGFKIALIALVVTAVLPVLRNTVVGIQQVDQSLVEAARGMGMRASRILRLVELPLAVPVMLAGLRTTIVIAVGVATVATFVNAGGLGDIIVAGIKLQRTPVLITGGVLTAVIALGLDWLGGLAERLLRPKGV